MSRSSSRGSDDGKRGLARPMEPRSPAQPRRPNSTPTPPPGVSPHMKTRTGRFVVVKHRTKPKQTKKVSFADKPLCSPQGRESRSTSNLGSILRVRRPREELERETATLSSGLRSEEEACQRSERGAMFIKYPSDGKPTVRWIRLRLSPSDSRVEWSRVPVDKVRAQLIERLPADWNISLTLPSFPQKHALTNSLACLWIQADRIPPLWLQRNPNLRPKRWSQLGSRLSRLGRLLCINL